ncbi:uncharacterized protein LOC134274342 isoform X2 [Saccostrea cucullata]|uniref:uncharacterized protein LOC134274342 isoform X2 n=1 Tax=Saccostrea cuccullata TaxID=36930 RepID=UPI002ED69C33
MFRDFEMDLSSLVIVLLTVLDTVFGLECSKCTHVVIKDPPSSLSSILQNIAIPESPQCANTPPAQAADGVSLVECPSNPTSGQVYKCGTYNGTLQVSVGIVKVSADIIYRDCVLTDPEVPAACAPQNNNPADNAVLNSVLKSVSPSLADINATFVGTKCVADERSMSSPRSTAPYLSETKIVLCTPMLLISNYLNHL